MEFKLNINHQELVKEITCEVIKAIKPMIAKGAQDDTVFNVEGLAQYLKVSPKWIYERTHLKEIPHNKIGGQLRFRKKDIDKWINSYNVPAINTPERILKAIK